MITLKQEADYTLVRINAKRWSNKTFGLMYNEVISLGDTPMVVDASKFIEPGKLAELAKGLSTMGEEHLVVLVAGEDLYEDYNILADLTIPVTPRLEEAVDMLFMIKMERELGLDEI